MSYYCPTCGGPAKRYAGATDQKEGLPVICPEHGRVFVNQNKLPILSLLSSPFSTQKGRRQASEAMRNKLYRQKNPHKDAEWRAKNTEHLREYNKRKRAEVMADPVALAALNKQRREWYARNRLNESARYKRRAENKKGEVCPQE